MLVLDSLEDPQNMGTLLRTAEAIGVHGVYLPDPPRGTPEPCRDQGLGRARPSTSCSSPVTTLPVRLADLHARGLRLVGADEDASLSYRDADLRGPLALVVGSEGQGISGAVRRRLDMVVRIPMRGKIASLNAAVAGSVLLLEAAAQRGLPAAPLAPRPDEAADDHPRPDRCGQAAAVEAPAEAPDPQASGPQGGSRCQPSVEGAPAEGRPPARHAREPAKPLPPPKPPPIGTSRAHGQEDPGPGAPRDPPQPPSILLHPSPMTSERQTAFEVGGPGPRARARAATMTTAPVEVRVERRRPPNVSLDRVHSTVARPAAHPPRPLHGGSARARWRVCWRCGATEVPLVQAAARTPTTASWPIPDRPNRSCVVDIAR